MEFYKNKLVKTINGTLQKLIGKDNKWNFTKIN